RLPLRDSCEGGARSPDHGGAPAQPRGGGLAGLLAWRPDVRPADPPFPARRWNARLPDRSGHARRRPLRSVLRSPRIHAACRRRSRRAPRGAARVRLRPPRGKRRASDGRPEDRRSSDRRPRSGLVRAHRGGHERDRGGDPETAGRVGLDAPPLAYTERRYCKGKLVRERTEKRLGTPRQGEGAVIAFSCNWEARTHAQSSDWSRPFWSLPAATLYRREYPPFPYVATLPTCPCEG